MNREDDLERLFSRYLDGECTAQERQRLHTTLRTDAAARAEFEAYRELDRAVGQAMRQAMGRTEPAPAWWTVRFRLATGLTLAAAACVALFLWLRPLGPGNHVPPPGSGTSQAAAIPSWFVAPGPQGDEVGPAPAAYERPELRVRDTRRHWLVVPAPEPGRYLIIEVDRVRTHVIGVHQDF